MFRILVVDDEETVRESIGNYLSRQKNLFTEVLVAGNGVEALKVLERTQPQIVLTDINMPFMDGLEFLEILRERYPELTVIILSGYDEFSYAQRAMRSGVEYYLLKPVNRRELLDLLTRLKEEYLGKVRDEEERIREETSLREKSERLCARLLHLMINDKIDCREWQYELEYLGIGKRAGVYCVCILKSENSQDFETRCEQAGIGVWLMMEMDGEKVLLMESDDIADFKQLCNVEAENPEMSGFWLGNVERDLSMVYSSYHVARGKAELAIYIEKDKNKQEELRQLEELRWKLVLFIKTQRCDMAKKCLSNIRKVLEGAYSEAYVRMECREVLYSVIFTLESLNGHGNMPWMVCEREGSYGGFASLEEWYKQLEKIMLDGMIQSRENAEKLQYNVVDKALRILKERWNETDLNLNAIADELYVSHNYLRYLLKEKTGQTFTQYLTQFRLERAVVLLEDSDMKVRDVAVQVGFEDAGYFTRIFTKKYACSPTEYRDRYREK